MKQKEISKQAKNEALCREFPFSCKYIKKEPYLHVLVSRVNVSLLEERRDIHIDSLKPVVRTTNKQIFILDEKGNEICEVGIKRRQEANFRWWNPFTWKKFHSVSETVRDALNRLEEGESKRAYYIILKETSLGRRLIIFKPPKGFTIHAWIKEELSRIDKIVQAEVEKINNI